MSCSPIGIYDSGLGGLTIFRALHDRLPNESLVYLGDGKNCPYGMRSRDEILGFAREAVAQLRGAGAKLIVVACNTATAMAIETLRRENTDIDIVGMEPALKPACLLTKSGVVGVLATQRSLEGDLFHRTADRYAVGIEVVARFGDGFVELVERNEEGSDRALDVVGRVVKPMVEAGVDQLVLGCTHYPFLKSVISKVAPNVNIIDPSEAVARRVEELLSRANLLADSGCVANYRFMTFADCEYRDCLEAKSGVNLW